MMLPPLLKKYKTPLLVLHRTVRSQISYHLSSNFFSVELLSVQYTVFTKPHYHQLQFTMELRPLLNEGIAVHGSW